MSDPHGYAGRILKVDLSDRTAVDIPVAAYADRFVGGRGVAVKIYWDEVPPKIGAFDPENVLILVTGPLAGFPGLAGSRWQICGKSPVSSPEFFSYANAGGSWGTWLKFAGYDAMVIRGRSDRPVYLLVQDGGVEIKDAAGLWGRGAIETREMLKATLGRDLRVAAIGPAGENMVVVATILADDDASGGSGFGAVMGSKKLKAIAVRAHPRKLTASDPEKLGELVRTIRELTRGSRDVYAAYQRYSTLVIENPRIRRTACYGCSSGCGRAVYTTENGRSGKFWCVPSLFYADWAKRYYGEWNDVPFQAAQACDEYGLDVKSVLAIIKWLEGCHQAGILTETGTGIPLSKVGSLEFIDVLVRKISLRQGFGDVLARGILKAAEAVSDEAKEQLGQNLDYRTGQTYAYEPRLYIITGLLYATEPRQPIQQLHEVVYPIHLWLNYCHRSEGAYVSTGVMHTIARKFFGSEAALDLSTYDGKATVAKRIQDRAYIKECLILCDFAWPIMDVRHSEEHVGDPALESRVFTAVTGREVDEPELRQIGERVFNLQRAIFIREGHKGREGDSLRELDYTVPLSSGTFDNPECLVPGRDGEIISRMGAVVDRGKFEKLKDEYYQLRGWDVKSGLQTKVRLVELGLQDIIQCTRIADQ